MNVFDVCRDQPLTLYSSGAVPLLAVTVILPSQPPHVGWFIVVLFMTGAHGAITVTHHDDTEQLFPWSLTYTV